MIAVLGSAGQLGRDLVPRLEAAFGPVTPLTRAEMDLESPESVRGYFELHAPTWFVNCAAYNLVDAAERDPARAYQVNAWGVRHLAESAARVGCRLLHVSTDYVFGLHTSDRPWRETDAPGPVSEYGRSKLAGEYAVRASDPKHLVVRTCGLYGVWGSGGKGTNFVETMLKLAGQNKPLKVVADQVCTPTATADLAEALVQLMATGAAGLFHATNSGQTSWHGLAREIFAQSNLTVDLSPTTTAEYGAPARRPGYSVLDCRKLAEAGVPPMADWRAAVARYLDSRRGRFTN